MRRDAIINAFASAYMVDVELKGRALRKIAKICIRLPLGCMDQAPPAQHQVHQNAWTSCPGLLEVFGAHCLGHNL